MFIHLCSVTRSVFDICLLQPCGSPEENTETVVPSLVGARRHCKQRQAQVNDQERDIRRVRVCVCVCARGSARHYCHPKQCIKFLVLSPNLLYAILVKPFLDYRPRHSICNTCCLHLSHRHTDMASTERESRPAGSTWRVTSCAPPHPNPTDLSLAIGCLH